MKIVGLSAVIPSKRIDIEETVDLVRFYSKSVPTKELNKILLHIKNFYQQAGSQTRSWRMPCEKPIDLICKAAFDASAQSGIPLSELDALIYCSIYRGVLEPASASLVCNHLNINPKHAFDILDACMGWCSALETSQQYLSSGRWKSVLIIASEFPNESNGALVPGCYNIGSEAELKTKIAGLTMGEAVAATILTESNSNVWNFVRKEDSQFAHLCSVPLRGHHFFSVDKKKMDANGFGIFCAYAKELTSNGYRKSLSNLKSFFLKYGAPDTIVPHSVSHAFPKRLAEKLEYKGRVISTFSEFGNLSSASVPVSLSAGILRKLIHRNDTIAGYVGSAGMKYCTFDLHVADTLF